MPGASARQPKYSGPISVKDWNTVVTLFQEPRAYGRARGILRTLGDIAATDYHNVLVMRVDSVEGFLRDFSAMIEAEPGLLNDISRVVPMPECFDFTTPEDFEDKARAIALSWASRLKGSSFYVRLHRRGLRGTIKSPEEERFLDTVLLAALKAAGTPGLVRFEDPDYVIDIETIDHRAGMSLWSREDLKSLPFLKID